MGEKQDRYFQYLLLQSLDGMVRAFGGISVVARVGGGRKSLGEEMVDQKSLRLCVRSVQSGIRMSHQRMIIIGGLSVAMGAVGLTDCEA